MGLKDIDRAKDMYTLVAILRTASTALLLLVLGGCGAQPESWPKEIFSYHEWSIAPEEERYVFAKDLVERRLLEGKRYSEIEALLGKPSSDQISSANYVSYLLKVGGFNFNDFNQVWTLTVKFDPETGVSREVFIQGD